MGHGGISVKEDEDACTQHAISTHPASRIGREGRLHLSLCRHNHRTILAGCRSEPPLSVQRALYCEQGLPGMAYVYISSTSGGMLQGDRHIMRMKLGADAMAHVTTQGATRIYGAGIPQAGGGPAAPTAARQTIHASVDERAYLEFIPDQTIPYAGSAFVQDVAMSVHDTATAAYAEILSPGRAGMGESFAYRMYDTSVSMTNQNGALRLVDAARITPLDSRVKSLGMMHTYDTMASMYVMTEQRHVSPLQQEIDSMILHDDAVSGGAAISHNDTGVLVRILGSGTEPVKCAIHEAARIVRRTVLGAPFAQVRKS